MAQGSYNPGIGYRVTSGYGWRVKPGSTTGQQEFHGGIDYAATAGTPIHAAASGTVVYSGANSSYGNTVVVKTVDENGKTLFYTVYAHQQSIEAMPKVGTTVSQGDSIGQVGNTGISYGAHLHFEVLDKSANVSPASGGPIGFTSSDQKIHIDPDLFNFDTGTILKPIEITISDATANEKEGTITFTININKELDKDFTFNVSTIDGSATGNEDYMTIPNAPVTIKAGSKQTTYSIPIANDGIYEINEEFMLYAHYEKGTYTGYDLGKVTGGTATGTITDDLPAGACPTAVTPNFGFNFTVPTPIVSASYFFTCKTFTISKALHVENKIQPKEKINSEKKVA